MNSVTFSDLQVSNEVLRAVEAMGFVSASEIQAQAIPHLLQGSDVIGQAQTGTGKTAAFGIPILDSIERGAKKMQALILCPTRELAIQISEELLRLSDFRRDIRILPVYGGSSIERQIRDLRRGVHIVVGTPGRVIDHIERGTLRLNTISTVVLDEADEMLNMGFRPPIEKILSNCPKERQTVLFSATMSAPILQIAREHQKNPISIKVASKSLTADKIDQCYYEAAGAEKNAMIPHLVNQHELNSTIVFCNTKRRVDVVVKKLRAAGMRADGIHGGLTQSKRNSVLTAFKKGFNNVLVATDVAARGIDISNVDGVVNYDLPLDPEFYVHRIGRTGRAGKSGKAFTFVKDRDEVRRLRSIERYVGVTMQQHSLPSVLAQTIKEMNAADNRTHKESNEYTRTKEVRKQGDHLRRKGGNARFDNDRIIEKRAPRGFEAFNDVEEPRNNQRTERNSKRNSNGFRSFEEPRKDAPKKYKDPRRESKSFQHVSEGEYSGKTSTVKRSKSSAPISEAANLKPKRKEAISIKTVAKRAVQSANESADFAYTSIEALLKRNKAEMAE